MALPLPKVVPDVGPGGPLVTAMGGMNALQKKILENQYYGPNIESEMAQRNALTNRYNTLTPLEAQHYQLQNQYYAPNIESEMAYRNAQRGAIPSEVALRQSQMGLAQQQANKLKMFNEHPGFYGGEDAKTLEFLRMQGYIPNPAQQGAANPMNATSPQPNGQSGGNALNFSGNNAAPYNVGNPLVNSVLNRRYAQPAYQQQMTNAFDWVHTTPDAKNYEIAVGAGMGITPDAFVAERTKGKSIAQIAQDHGFNPNQLPEPDFLPTKGNITKLKSRQAALKEASSLNKFVTEALAPYSSQINGRSFQQIADVISGQNKEAQKKFFAGYMLTPEVANIRQNLAQGNVGVTASQEIMQRSLMNIKPFTSLIDPEVFKGAQELADQKLSEAFGEAEKVYQVAKPSKKSGLKPINEMTLEELKAERDRLRGNNE
jgi:hypothetical protein